MEEDFLSNGPFIIRGLWRFRISSFSKSRVAFWKCSDFRLKNDGSLPERFEVPRNFFQIQRLLSILAVFSSMNLFFGISVIAPPIFHSFWTNQILKVTEDNSFRPFFLCWFEICFPKFVPSSKIQLTRHLTRRTIKSSYRYRLMMFKIFQVRSEKSDSCRLFDFLSCYQNQGFTDSKSLIGAHIGIFENFGQIVTR